MYSYLWVQDPQTTFENFLEDNEPKDEDKDGEEEGT